MNNSDKITFIIPNRGGKHLDFVTSKIKQMYPETKIIIITQDDDKPFARGQLFNIAYNYVNTEYMCFIDNDMFFPNYIDLISEYNKLNCIALQPFVNIQQVKISENNYEVLSEKRKSIWGKGGSTFISKKNFEKVNGFSNLYLRYGNEDTDFNDRCSGIVDIDLSICHIAHESRCADWHWKINKTTHGDFINRNSSLDGYKNTTYNLLSDKVNNNIRFININNISVDKDFAYNEILKLHNKK